jgi:hypothetical protein
MEGDRRDVALQDRAGFISHLLASFNLWHCRDNQLTLVDVGLGMEAQRK